MGGAQVITNEGAGAIFGPLALPIIGSVGDYGDLEDVEEDDNVRFLRARLGTEGFDLFIEGCTRGGNTPVIDKIARGVARTRYNKKYGPWDGTLSGCWVAREAWDLFSTKSWNEDGTPRATVCDDGWLDPQSLKVMGFIPGPEDKERAIALFGDGPHDGSRYHTPYTHKSLPELIVWCDEHMSSKASYKGVKIEIGLKFQAFLKALKKRGLTLPEKAIAAVANTSVYRGHLMQAREEQDRSAGLSKTHEAFLKQYPQSRFRRIEEGDTECTHVFCSRDPYQNGRGPHLHVTLTGKAPSETDMSEAALRGEVESFTITPCTGERHKETWKPGMEFTPAVWDALKEAGWRPRKRKMPTSGANNPYLRGFPEEALELYRYRRNTLLSDRFLPMVEKLLCFEGNMYAANKMLTPTLSGWQCGNNATQREVAKMALKLLTARANRWK
jgi:hypothetical protein